MFRGLKDQLIVGVGQLGSRFPVAVIKVRLLEADLGGVAIVVLQKLGLVAGGAQGGVAGVIGTKPGGIGGEKGFAVDGKVEVQSLFLIAGYPHSVDQALIVGVNRKGVFAGMQIGGNIDFIIIVGIGITGSRPLGNEDAIDVKFVVIVGGDLQKGICGAS